jgi:hypothetical protein
VSVINFHREIEPANLLQYIDYVHATRRQIYEHPELPTDTVFRMEKCNTLQWRLSYKNYSFDLSFPSDLLLLLDPIADLSGREAYVCCRLVTGIAGSNPARAWMFVSCVYMSCCPV